MTTSSPWKPIAIGTLVVVAIMLAAPFVWPLPPSSGTQDAHALADKDSTFLVVDGLELHVKSAGSGGIPVVMLHSGAQDAFTWREVLPALSASRMAVAYDRTGHGLSSRPAEWTGPNPYAASTQAEVLIKLMDALKIPRAVVMGHGSGAALALYSVEKWPDRFAGAVLVAPGSVAAMERGMGFVQRMLVRSPYGTRLGPAILERQLNVRGKDVFAQFWHDPKKLSPEILDGYTRHTKVSGWSRAGFEIARAVEPLPVEAGLKDVRIPVLVVDGDDDRFVPAGENDALAKALPNAKHVTLKGCGHVVHEECADAFNAEVGAFLSTIGAP